MKQIRHMFGDDFHPYLFLTSCLIIGVVAVVEYSVKQSTSTTQTIQVAEKTS